MNNISLGQAYGRCTSFVVEISTVKNYLMLLKVYLVAMDHLKCKLCLKSEFLNKIVRMCDELNRYFHRIYL